ncbi:MAG: hypothetical protein HEP71_34620 [Roseivirga sp.]|nr:hypothetical protein [Roseivirga sp.]
MNIRKYIIALLAVCLCGFGSMAQVDSGIDLQKMVQVPSSPEAAGFQQYGNMDVNLHMGKPNIAVPLYVHQGREIQLPMTLSYSSGGIKVLQMASNVGLGWSLIASGSITRQKLGMADDEGVATYRPRNTNTQTFIDEVATHQSDPTVERTTAQLNLLFDIQKKTEEMKGDTQPDVYSFSTATGFSGTIYYDYHNAVAYCIEDPTVKITPTLDTSGVPIGWLIYDASGNQYHFMVKEYTEYTYTGGVNEYASSYISSWFLDKIVSANGKDTYEFNYTENPYWEDKEDLHYITGIENRPTPTGGGSGLAQACPAVPGVTSLSNGSKYAIKPQYLSSIKWNTKTIADIIYTSTRLDLPNGKEVDNIIVSNGTDDLKQFNFNYSHFGDTNNGASGTDNRIKLRLKLDNITIDGMLGLSQPAVQTWSFDYFDASDVPPRDVTGVDYWGYYNGQDGNSDLIPSGKFGSTHYSGANRYPSLTHTKAGTLSKIHYPTGGYSEFIYELNGYEQTTQTTQTNSYFLESVEGGTDLSDPYDFTGSTAPKAVTGTFTIDNNSEEFLISLTGTAPLAGGDVYVYVFPEVTTWDHAYAELATGGVSKTYDELEMAESQSLSINNLSNGTYRYLVYNSIANSTVYLSYTATETITANSTVNVGGLRIASIESYTQASELAGKRVFEYAEAQVQKDLDFDEIKTTQVRNAGTDYTCTSYYRYSNNRSTDVGKDISYGLVTEKLVDGSNDNGYTKHYFINEDLRTLNPYSMHLVRNGKLSKQEVFDTNDNRLVLTENDYAQVHLSGTGGIYTPARGAYFETEETVVGYRRRIDGTTAGNESYEYIPWHTSDPASKPSVCITSTCEYGSWAIYQLYPFRMDSYFTKLQSSKTTQFLDGGSLETLTTFNHNETTHFQLVSQTITDSEGDTWTVYNYYPDDVSANTSLPGGTLGTNAFDAIGEMKTRHQINRLVQTEQKKNSSTLISRQRTNYRYWNSNSVQPEFIQTAKASNALETRVRFHDYNTDANPQEVSQEGGNKIVYLWGYGGRYPVAKIENADHSTVDAVISQSTLDAPTSDAVLRTELDKLRSATTLRHAIITTMTYQPGIGITSQTSPNGITAYYEYDSLGRLKFVKDRDGNILKMNEYEYQTLVNTTGN